MTRSTMANATPGPWKLGFTQPGFTHGCKGKSAHEIYGANAKIIALLPVPDYTAGRPNNPEQRAKQDANARLIVAAPDLLSALQIGADTAQAVVDNWEAGDLARSVHALELWIGETARAGIIKATEKN